MSTIVCSGVSAPPDRDHLSSQPPATLQQWLTALLELKKDVRESVADSRADSVGLTPLIAAHGNPMASARSGRANAGSQVCLPAASREGLPALTFRRISKVLDRNN